MQPKCWIASALFFALPALGGGCSKAPTDGPAPEPLTLRVACPPGAADEVVRSYSKVWQYRNNGTVVVTEYGAAGPEGTNADAWVIPAAELGLWAAAEQLLPVPEPLQEKDGSFGWKGLLPLYREDLLRWERTAYALPLIGEAPLFCYRSDHYKDAGLKPPATWKDVEDGAAHFFKKLGKPSLLPLPNDDEGLEREFYTIAAGYVRRAVSADITLVLREEALSFHYDPTTGQARIDSPGFVHALALLQRLQQYRAPTDDTPVEAFRKGVGVFCLTDAREVFRLQDVKSAVRDKFAVVRTPATEVYYPHSAGSNGDAVRAGVGGNWMPYLGAGVWLGVVPKTSAHAEDAFSLLADLAGRAVSRQVVLSPRVEPPRGGGAYRADHFDRNARWEVFDLDSTRTDEFKKVVQATVEHVNVANPVYRLRTPDERQRRALLVRELRAALKDPSSDPASALRKVASEWKAMDAGNAKYLEEYRLAIGLKRR